MIIPTGEPDRVNGQELNKIYRTHGTDAVQSAARRDVVTISKLSTLVEIGRKQALSLPEVRMDRVEQARASLGGCAPRAEDVASAMIEAAREGQV